MSEYNIEREFKKIQFAFQKVKQDYEHVLRRLHVVEKENITILNKLNTKKKSTTTTKVIKTISDKVYIANKSSKKVHSQDCPYGKKITTERREIFDTIPEALKAKYTRCSCVMS
jgi:hypothetical protein